MVAYNLNGEGISVKERFWCREVATPPPSDYAGVVFGKGGGRILDLVKPMA